MFKTKWRLIVVTPVFLSLAIVAAVLAAASDEPVVRHVVSADGKMITIREGDKVLFLGGVGADARQLASLDIKGQQAIASRHGKAIALCSQFINTTGPVSVYDNAGRKIGQFDVELPWKAIGVSDDGQLVVLGRKLSGRSPSVLRLANLTGESLAEYNTDPTYATFTPDGLPLVWGAHADNRYSYVSVLTAQGKPASTWEYEDGARWIHQVAASAKAEVVAILDAPRSESFPDMLTLWRPSQGTRSSVALLKSWGTVQTDGVAISPDGSFVALRMGAASICLISTARPSVKLTMDVSLMAGQTDKVVAILRISQLADNGTISLQCLLDSGETVLIDVDAAGAPLRTVSIGR